MKRLNILTLVLILFFYSCEKELHKYEGKPTIYFNEAGRLPAYSGEVIRDSTIMSFSLSKAKDSIVSMVISTISNISDVDRNYGIHINDKSTVQENEHFELLNKDFIIKAGQLKDTVLIKFLRTNEMLDSNFVLIFDLVENENFSVDMKEKTLSNGVKHNFSTYTWYVNDIIKKPGRWMDAYFGTFTRKKLFLMVEILGIEASYLDASVSIPEMTAFGRFMNRYLNDQKNLGKTIFEEDGITEMTMGSASQ
ncbi:DUF4843 domain-containing protein [Sphingobacterium bovistauri]|uniref:DUF4843 domain-containing protein n=1 Tax=Sphingobacterium bovistauri TaxID=2781959 RepID=A0ABS7Z625_9SPHI|nr:DUF4843 domain-containing protein [Sphingobacterium bovistauri]MCA5005638.1 DUF4843 domain-containing protein [Sphingobacterium bovistauri]